MRDSQGHRPAVSISTSALQGLKKKMGKAAELEKQLAATPSMRDKAYMAIRTELCEIFSDVMCAHAAFALQVDCVGRLWTRCFYKHINDARQRISREKRKGGPAAQEMERHLKLFLSEAMDLYRYLINHYQSKLLELSGATTAEAESSGLVETLFRLNVYMGDLHRYDRSFSKAEACYSNASKLGPGIGNPCNQLAVVAQTKQNSMTCVSLYWYTRSLMATHEAFGTSGKNLEGLFNANKRYLAENSRDPVAPRLTAKESADTSDIGKGRKAMVSKACLAHFVDLQFDIFRGTKDIATQTSSVLQSLESLLKSSAFSDSLLCKMSTILICSAVRRRSQSMESTSYLLGFLSTFLQKVKEGASKMLEKGQSASAPSIRCLMPLLILLLFLESCDDEIIGAHIQLWTNICEVATMFSQIQEARQLSASNLGYQDVKELHLLKGFRPCQFMHPEYAVGTPYLSCSEACDRLELATARRPVVAGASASRKLSESDKGILLFLDFCRRMSKKDGMPCTECNGVFVVDAALPTNEHTTGQQLSNVWQGSSSKASERIEQPIVGMVPEDNDDHDDDAGDCVVYTVPDAGSPPLLVPKDLTATASGGPSRNYGVEEAVSNSTTASATADINMIGHSAQRISTPSQLKPPPGFGLASSEQSTNAGVHSTIRYEAAAHLYGTQNKAAPMDYTTSSNILPSAQFNMPQNSISWFGGHAALATQNPYADSNLYSYPGAIHGDSTADEEAAAIEPATLLGSGLLHSIGDGERCYGETRNPFR